MALRLTFLGTGTSHGVPMIGCECPVCRSTNPKNHRNRCSAYLEFDGHGLLIDTPPELRLAALSLGVRNVEAVLLTHSHADHLAGFDDLRRFNELSGRSLPVYANEETVADLRQRWSYIFSPDTQIGGGLPQVDLHAVSAPFPLLGKTVIPIPVWHGRLPVFGFRLDNLAYITDCSSLPEASRALLSGLDCLILGAIRRRPHPTHLHLDGALQIAAELGAKKTYLTHLTHLLEHEEISRELPPEVELAYDGLVIEST